MKVKLTLTNGWVITKDISKGTVEFINSHRDGLFKDVEKVEVLNENNNM